MKNKLILLIFVFSILSARAEIKLNNKFVNAIIQVESSGNNIARGDKVNGKYLALGCAQIHYVFFLDAAQYDKTINFSYSSLTNRANSIKVMTAYLNRYGQRYIKLNDFKSLALLFHCGPNWKNSKYKNDGYYEKVSWAMNKS